MIERWSADLRSYKVIMFLHKSTAFADNLPETATISSYFDGS